MYRASGLLLIDPRKGAALFVRRSAAVPAPGTWSVPGGLIEHGEKPLASAMREMVEETGVRPICSVVSKVSIAAPQGTYVLHVGTVSSREAKRVLAQHELNWEHDELAWFDIKHPPAPLHPGMQAVWPMILDLAPRLRGVE